MAVSETVSVDLVVNTQTSKSVSPRASTSGSVIVNNYSGEKATVTESISPSGEKVTQVLIGAVKNSMANGGFDSIMASRYGTRYPGVRR